MKSFKNVLDIIKSKYNSLMIMRIIKIYNWQLQKMKSEKLQGKKYSLRRHIINCLKIILRYRMSFREKIIRQKDYKIQMIQIISQIKIKIMKINKIMKSYSQKISSLKIN